MGTTRWEATVTTEDGTIRGRVTIVQSDFGIKPFSIMMGALKVADPVKVQIEAKLPTG